MKKTLLYFLILILAGCSINVDQAFEKENFDPNKEYEPLSLHLKGQPIFSIGQKLASINSSLSIQKDESGKYHQSPQSITDYICHDRNLAIWFNTGSISGSIQFSSDNEQNRIFRCIGFWMFNLPNNTKNLNEAKQRFSKEFFPALVGKINFKKDWRQTIEHPNYREIFKLKRNKKLDSWVLSYEVKLK